MVEKCVVGLCVSFLRLAFPVILQLFHLIFRKQIIGKCFFHFCKRNLMEIAHMFNNSLDKGHIVEVLLIRVSGISQKLLYSKCLFSMNDVGG